METKSGLAVLATTAFVAALLALPANVAFDAETGALEVVKSVAHADDDDDDDDGGGGGGGGGGYRGGGNDGGGSRSGRDWSDGPGGVRPRGGFRWLFGAPRRPAARTTRRAAPPPPAAAPNEIVAIGLSSSNLDALVAEGFTIVATSDIPGRGNLARLGIPGGIDAEAARLRIASIAPGVLADMNHFYRPQAVGECDAQICPMWRQVGWSCPAGASDAGGLTIGVIDTGVNAEHDFLADSRLEVIAFREESAKPSERVHGTAVVAMLIGAPESRVPGLLPRSRVIVADPFSVGARGDERSDTYALVRALEHFVTLDLPVVNLSLAGPANAVLEDTVRRASTQGVALVAAVGNAGPRSEPLYPAAYQGVIGVTAVDARQRVYRRAVQGDHVDISAPGVAIPTAASVRGVRPKSGTSFATPFVTAAVAVMKAAEPEIALADIKARLAESAVDLGEAGRDSVFGWGLLQANGLCPGIASSEQTPTTVVD